MVRFIIIDGTNNMFGDDSSCAPSHEYFQLNNAFTITINECFAYILNEQIPH